MRVGRVLGGAPYLSSLCRPTESTSGSQFVALCPIPSAGLISQRHNQPETNLRSPISPPRFNHNRGDSIAHPVCGAINRARRGKRKLANSIAGARPLISRLERQEIKRGELVAIAETGADCLSPDSNQLILRRRLANELPVFLLSLSLFGS